MDTYEAFTFGGDISITGKTIADCTVVLFKTLAGTPTNVDQTDLAVSDLLKTDDETPCGVYRAYSPNVIERSVLVLYPNSAPTKMAFVMMDPVDGRIAKPGDEMDLPDNPNPLAILQIQDGLSTFDPSTNEVDIGKVKGAAVTSIDDFKATGFATLNPDNAGIAAIEAIVSLLQFTVNGVKSDPQTPVALVPAYDKAMTAAQAGDKMDLIDALNDIAVALIQAGLLKPGEEVDLVNNPNPLAILQIQDGLSTFDATQDEVSLSDSAEDSLADKVWNFGRRTLTGLGNLAASIVAAITGSFTPGVLQNRLTVTNGKAQRIARGDKKTLSFTVGPDWDLTGKKVYLCIQEDAAADNATAIVNRACTVTGPRTCSIELTKDETAVVGKYTGELEVRNDTDEIEGTAMQFPVEIFQDVRH